MSKLIKITNGDAECYIDPAIITDLSFDHSSKCTVIGTTKLNFIEEDGNISVYMYDDYYLDMPLDDAAEYINLAK